MFYTIAGIILFLILISIRQINQYERGVKFMFGRYYKTMNPGWRLVWPVIQTMSKVDIRVKAVDVPLQETITKDNVTAKINAVIYYKVSDSARAILEVENFRYAVSQLAQTTMRNVIGELELDELLAQRDAAAGRIKEIIDKATDPWGIKVEAVELKDVILPDDMQRTIGKQAEAEREKRAKIISAEGEFLSAQKLADTADIMMAHPIALQLRNLQTLAEIATEKNSTIIFPAQLMSTVTDIHNFLNLEKKRQG